MTKIVYKIKDDWGEVRETFGTGNPLSIVIDPSVAGYVTIGECTSEILDGVAKFDLAKLTDGEYVPIVSGEIHARLEPIRKTGDNVTIMPTSDETLRRLLVRTELLEKSLSNLIARVDKLSAIYEKQVIF